MIEAWQQNRAQRWGGRRTSPFLGHDISGREVDWQATARPARPAICIERIVVSDFSGDSTVGKISKPDSVGKCRETLVAD